MINKNESLILFSLFLIGMVIISIKVIKGQKKFGLKYNLSSLKKLFNGFGLSIKNNNREEFQFFVNSIMKQFIIMIVICIIIMIILVTIFHI